ncbi:hypothetical protein BDZ45DRAFT_697634 [Acephala macrosclerotiorum]|nr:hypothetical protein BDZ45DRAFT_697634 [Acephala macrosclerotiorum]
MFHRILNERAERARPFRPQVIHYQVLQGFSYDLVSENDFDVKRNQSSDDARASTFTVSKLHDRMTVTKKNSAPHQRTSTYDVSKRPSGYTVVPQSIPNTTFFITHGVMGHSVSKISGGPLLQHDPNDSSRMMAAVDAFDIGIFMTELNAENEWDALLDLPTGLSLRVSGYLPPHIENQITARRLANAP